MSEREKVEVLALKFKDSWGKLKKHFAWFHQGRTLEKDEQEVITK